MRFLKSILKKTFGISFVLVLMLLVAGCGEKLADQKARSQEEKEILFSKKREEIGKLRSLGDPESIKKAMQMEIDNAKAGSALSKWIVSSAYRDGILGFEKNFDQHKFWLEKIEKESTPEEAYEFSGLDLKLLKNKSASIKWLDLANQKGYQKAPCSLAIHYIEEKIRAASEIASLLKKGRYLNDPACDFSEAVLLINGYNEIPKDDIKAFSLMTQAAENGVPRAEFSLGLMYAEGVGINKNEKASLFWIKKAAENGVLEAKQYLAEKYRYKNSSKNNTKPA